MCNGSNCVWEKNSGDCVIPPERKCPYLYDEPEAEDYENDRKRMFKEDHGGSEEG